MFAHTIRTRHCTTIEKSKATRKQLGAHDLRSVMMKNHGVSRYHDILRIFLKKYVKVGGADAATIM